VPWRGIEPRSLPYQGSILPLNDKGNGAGGVNRTPDPLFTKQ
jgi:hypothetical protein